MSPHSDSERFTSCDSVVEIFGDIESEKQFSDDDEIS